MLVRVGEAKDQATALPVEVEGGREIDDHGQVVRQVEDRLGEHHLSPVRALGRLAARKDSTHVVVTAIARELTGFLWAEMAA